MERELTEVSSVSGSHLRGSPQPSSASNPMSQCTP